MKLTKLVAVVGLAAALGCGGVDGGLSDPQVTPAEVEGLAISGMADDGSGQAVTGAFAILIDKEGQRTIRRTGEDGTFRFESVKAGDLTLVLNDLMGKGVIRRMIVVGGGANDIGAFELSPLEKQPEVFGIANIGFEERITETTGDHRHPRFSSDGAFAASFVGLPGEYGATLTRTDLATGEEQAFSTETSFAGTDYSLGKHLVLHQDRFAVYEASRKDELQADSNSYHVVSIDLQTGAEVLVPNTPGTLAYPLSGDVYSDRTWIYWRAWHLANGAFYYFQQVGREKEIAKNPEPAPIMGNCWVCGRRMELCRVDLATGSRGCVALNSTWDAYRTFDNWVFTDREALYQVGLTFQDEMYGGGPGSTHPGPIQRVRFDTMKTETYVGGSVFSYRVSRDGRTLYYTTPGYPGSANHSTLYARDLVDGTETVLYSTDPAQGSLTSIEPSPDGSHVAVMGGASSSYGGTIVGPTGAVVDVATGKALTFDGSATYIGQTLSGFGYAYSGGTWSGVNPDSVWTPDGKALYLWRSIYEDEYQKLFGEKKAIVVRMTLPLDGSAPILDTFTTAENPLYSSTPAPVVSPDGAIEVSAQRMAETGFSQLFVREAGAEGWTQATFVTAQHGEFAFTADQARVAYVTRDPVTGYVQFFRIHPKCFLDPENTLVE